MKRYIEGEEWRGRTAAWWKNFFMVLGTSFTQDGRNYVILANRSEADGFCWYQ